MENRYLSSPGKQMPLLHAVRNYGEVPDFGDELAHWFNPLNFYVYLWQPNRLRNYLLTRNRFFREAFKLPHFSRLWENIVKGSFAYNVFLFKKPAFGRYAGNTFVADLTCLALLFGDEFIDGLCNELGKCYMQQLLVVDNKRFYLKIKQDKNGYPQLEYNFDLYNLLPADVWERKNEKYGISYRLFYELLKDLLELMNSRLRKMNRDISFNAAEKIKKSCNLCFDTYIHDINELPVQLQAMNNRTAVSFHEKKNLEIQTRLLELRCILLNKSVSKYATRFTGWLNIISTMQVYDDMQDCRLDDRFQDNLLLEFASKNFPEELHWFHSNKTRFLSDEEWRLQISLNMPCSVYMCIAFSKEKITVSMTWTQKKICNYLWGKNWFVPINRRVRTGRRTSSFRPALEMLTEMMEKTKNLRTLTGSEKEWKSYVLETAFHDTALKKFIHSKIRWRDIYFLGFNFLQLNSGEKAKMLDRILS